MEVDTEGWTAPIGNEMAAVEFLTEADPIAAWVDALPDDWDGRPVKECLQAYIDETGESPTPVLMGRRINVSKKWRSVFDSRRRFNVLKSVKVNR